MRVSSALVIASVIVSSVNAYVIPPADSSLWDNLPDAPRLRPLPKGLDLPHRGKVFAPARLRQQHDAEEAARRETPCPGKAMRGYGMGPFRVSSSSLSDLLDKLGLGFLPSSTSSMSSDSTADEKSEFRILPARYDGTEVDAAFYPDNHWKMESLDEWIEHVKERHAKVIGPHVFGDIHAYSIQPEEARHGRVARLHAMKHGKHGKHGCFLGRIHHALQALHPTELFFLAFTFGAGLGALARIVFMLFLLLKRSHEHLNSPPEGDDRRSVDEEAEPMLPPYSEVENSKNLDEKVHFEATPVMSKSGGIPVAYL